MKKGTINIYDYIGAGGIESKDILNIIDEFKVNDVSEIEVRINSSGGSIFEGFSIFNQLRDFITYGGSVTTIVDGIAASISSIIALAGNSVKAYKNSYIFIHNPWSFAVGDTNDMKKVSDDLSKFRDTIINLYKSKTGKSEDELKEFCNRSTFLTSDEALELGFIDEIIDNYPQTKNYVALFSSFDGAENVAADSKEAFTSTFDSNISEINVLLSEIKASLISLNNENNNALNPSNSLYPVSFDVSAFETILTEYINSGKLLPATKESFISFLNSLNTQHLDATASLDAKALQINSLINLIDSLPVPNLLQNDFASKPAGDIIDYSDEYDLQLVDEDSLSLHHAVKKLMNELNISYNDALQKLILTF